MMLCEMEERRPGYSKGGMTSSLKKSVVSNQKFADTYQQSCAVLPSKAQQPQDWVYNRGQIKKKQLDRSRAGLWHSEGPCNTAGRCCVRLRRQVRGECGWVSLSQEEKQDTVWEESGHIWGHDQVPRGCEAQEAQLLLSFLRQLSPALPWQTNHSGPLRVRFILG